MFRIPILNRGRQHTPALGTSVRGRCQALTAEAELMLRPWPCCVTSAEHLHATLNPEILRAVICVGLIPGCASSRLWGVIKHATPLLAKHRMGVGHLEVCHFLLPSAPPWGGLSPLMLRMSLIESSSPSLEGSGSHSHGRASLYNHPFPYYTESIQL